MAMLVEAPAAVEDALASLLDHPEPLVQVRGVKAGSVGNSQCWRATPWFWWALVCLGRVCLGDAACGPQGRRTPCACPSWHEVTRHRPQPSPLAAPFSPSPPPSLPASPLCVQRRALATYIRRLYYPYLLHEPEVQALQGGALAAGAPAPSCILLRRGHVVLQSVAGAAGGAD